jgi:transcription initiation factor TFIIH subunit 1
MDEVKRKRLRLEERTGMDDLSTAAHSDPNSWQAFGAKPLVIKDRELYMMGPTSSSSACDTNGSSSFNHAINVNNKNASSPSSLIESASSQEHRLSQWMPLTKHSELSSEMAISAISELSPGGALLKSTHASDLKDSIPLDVQKELRNVYLACNELLRHFWQCFPVTNEKLEEKLMQMKMTLEKFQYTKLQPLQNKLSKSHYDTDLTTHLAHQLSKALNRFSTWQAKKGVLARK